MGHAFFAYVNGMKRNVLIEVFEAIERYVSPHSVIFDEKAVKGAVGSIEFDTLFGTATFYTHDENDREVWNMIPLYQMNIKSMGDKLWF